MPIRSKKGKAAPQSARRDVPGKNTKGRPPKVAKPGSKPKPRPKAMAHANYNYPDQFGELLGYRVVRADPERREGEVHLTVQDKHLSVAGRMHGGVVATMVDAAFGAAVFSTLGPSDYCSTVELKLNYLRPLNRGDKLRAICRVVFRGNRLCVLNGMVYREGDSEPVVMATATFNVVRATV